MKQEPWQKKMGTLGVLLLVLIACVATRLDPVAAQFPDTFESPNLANWVVCGGSPKIDNTTGNPPPSLKLSNPSNDNSFGGQTDSVYLNNPMTVDFQDGIIEFDIRFDNDPGMGDVAVITFRMLDSKTYYGAALSNTWNWGSSFILVQQGQVAKIGNQSALQAFPTRSWSHVTVIVRGSSLRLLKDDEPLFSAVDATWSEGKWGGIGIYSAYFAGSFHIDNFYIRDTSKPLTYRSAFTQLTTMFSTSMATFTASTTTVTTSTATSISKTTVVSTEVSTLSETMMTTATSTVTQSVVPIQREPLVMIGAFILLLSLLGACFLTPKELAAILSASGIAIIGGLLVAVGQKTLTLEDASNVIAAFVIPVVVALIIGAYLRARAGDQGKQT